MTGWCAARRTARERGSVTVLAVAVLAAAVILTGAMLTLGRALVAHQRLAGATDSAAVAAADVVRGLRPGAPCDAASEVLRQAGARLEGCNAAGVVVTVASSATVVGIRIAAHATAGPPP